MQVPNVIERMEPSALLSSPSPHLSAHYFECFKFGILNFKGLYNQVIKREAAEWFIASYMYSFRYGIHVSRHEDPRITSSNDYGIMTPLSNELRAVCSERFLIEFF